MTAASTTILTRPVTKLCFLEMDGVADRVAPVYVTLHLCYTLAEVDDETVIYPLLTSYRWWRTKKLAMVGKREVQSGA